MSIGLFVIQRMQSPLSELLLALSLHVPSAFLPFLGDPSLSSSRFLALDHQLQSAIIIRVSPNVVS